MAYGFILVGGVILGMGFSMLWNTKSRIRIPKHLQTGTRTHYTLGNLWWADIKKLVKGLFSRKKPS
jgi:hypothetical protein